MAQAQTMTLHEKPDLGMKAIELEKKGKYDEAEVVEKKPLAPYLAKYLKDHLGTEALIQGDWNLVEAEAEYGTGWISK